MIKQALNAYAISSNKVWATDRSQTVGASEVGQCLRKTYWSKNENDPHYGTARDSDYVDGWGAKVRGTVYENEFWAPAMKAKYGEHFRYGGPEQRTFVSGFLSATPDGLLTGLRADALREYGIGDIESDCVTTECKSHDPRTNLTEPKPQNVFQTHVQMGLIRELTDYRPNYALLSYTDASWWDNVKVFAIKFDPAVYAQAKLRATKVMTATSATDLPAEGVIAGGKECEYCPFNKPCNVQRKTVPQQSSDSVDPQFAAEIADMAREIKTLEATAKDNDVHLRTLQEQLRDRLREKGVRQVPGVVSWSAVKGRTTFDNKAIQQAAIDAGIDISKFQKTGEATDRLTVHAP